MTFKKDKLLEEIAKRMEYYASKKHNSELALVGLNYGELKTRALVDRVESSKSVLMQLETMKNVLHYTDSTDIPLTFPQAALIFIEPPS